MNQRLFRKSRVYRWLFRSTIQDRDFWRSSVQWYRAYVDICEKYEDIAYSFYKGSLFQFGEHSREAIDSYQDYLAARAYSTKMRTMYHQLKSNKNYYNE